MSPKIDAIPELSPEDQLVQQELLELDRDRAFGVRSIYDRPDDLSMVKHYTEEPGIPQMLKGRFWAFFTNALPFTFLEEQDLEILHARIQAARIGEIMRRPAHDTTFEQGGEWDQIETHADIQAKRAVGTNGYRINERAMHQSQFAQRISLGSQPRPGASGGIRGFLRRLGGR